MPVDDQTVGKIDIEFAQYFPAKIAVINQMKIWILGFNARGFVVDKIIFESSELIFSKNRRERSCPQIPKEIEGASIAFAKDQANGKIKRIEKRPTRDRFSEHLEGQKISGAVHRNATVKN